MRVIIKGDIVNFVPFFNAYLDNEKFIISESGDFSLTVDTGFSGVLPYP